MKKTKVKMNKLLYLSMSVLDITETLMYGFWYDYIKPKYQNKTKLCHMDTESFIIHIKTEDFYNDIANVVEKWFDTSNYNKDDQRLLPIGKNKKNCFLKDKLRGKILKEFVGITLMIMKIACLITK